MKILLITIALLATAVQAGASDTASLAFEAEDSIYQLAPSAALTRGLYEGSTRFEHLLELGGFGLGALNAIDGEVILLDGKIYQASHQQGRLRSVTTQEHSPCFYLKRFREDLRITLKTVRDLNHLTAQIDAQLPTLNLLYAIRVDGEFAQITLRSVPPQRPPYPPINKVVEQQTVFKAQAIRGTLVAFRFPAYLSSVSGSGYHLHFVSEDRRIGGHVLNLNGDGLTALIDTSHGLTLMLPDDPAFRAADLDISAGDASKIYRDAIRPKNK